MRPSRATAQGTRSVATLIAALGCLVLLVVFGTLPGSSRWTAGLANAAHGPVFVVVTILLIRVQRTLGSRHGNLRQSVVAVAAAIVLGAAIECAQLFLARDASLEDLLHDAQGALAGALLSLWWDLRRQDRATSQRLLYFLPAGSTALVLLSMMPALECVAAYGMRQHNFPVLADFDQPYSDFFMEAYSAADIARVRPPSGTPGLADDVHALRARLRGSGGWALVLWEPSPDWRRFRHLELDLVNPTDEPLVVTVRVRDHRGRRPSVRHAPVTVEVAPESSVRARVDLERLSGPDPATGFDLGRVRGLVIGAHPDNRAREFYLLRLALAPD